MNTNEKLREMWETFNSLKAVEVEMQKAWEIARDAYVLCAAEVKRVKGTEREEWYAKGLRVLLKSYVRAKKAWWDARRAADKVFEEVSDMEDIVNRKILDDVTMKAMSMTPLEKALEECDKAEQKCREAGKVFQAAKKTCETAWGRLSVLKLSSGSTGEQESKDAAEVEQKKEWEDSLLSDGHGMRMR